MQSTKKEYQGTKLTFGVNPYDRCPEKQARYHVVDSAGFILAKYDYGYVAEGCAGSRSDKESADTFSVIDTRDGSVLVAFCDGEEITR